MDQPYFDIVFDKQDFSQNFGKSDYENCSFTNCILSNADLSDVNFSECTFTDCDLSMANMQNTALRNISFKGCKLLGLQFDRCNEFLFSVNFENCILNHSSFYKLKSKKTIFRNCSIVEVDFSDADLSGSIFDNCDLSGSTFQNSNLENADLRTASHYSIDPEINRIKKAKFSITGISGLLDKYDIEIE